jgi:hypothetical protein
MLRPSMSEQVLQPQQSSRASPDVVGPKIGRETSIPPRFESTAVGILVALVEVIAQCRAICNQMGSSGPIRSDPGALPTTYAPTRSRHPTTVAHAARRGSSVERPPLDRAQPLRWRHAELLPEDAAQVGAVRVPRRGNERAPHPKYQSQNRRLVGDVASGPPLCSSAPLDRGPRWDV